MASIDLLRQERGIGDLLLVNEIERAPFVELSREESKKLTQEQLLDRAQKRGVLDKKTLDLRTERRKFRREKFTKSDQRVKRMFDTAVQGLNPAEVAVLAELLSE